MWTALQQAHVDPAAANNTIYQISDGCNVELSPIAVQVTTQLNAGHAAPHPRSAHQPPSPTATAGGTLACIHTYGTGGHMVVVPPNCGRS